MSRSIAPLSKLTTAFAVTSTVIAGACSGNLADPDPFPPGLLAIQLQPGGPVQLESISYTVTGPNGFSRSGPVAVSLTDAHSSFSFKVEGLPPGDGYRLGVDADATLVQRGDATHCSGLTQFAIETGKSTAVSIRLQCDGVATTGSTNDDQTVNQCPLVKGLRAVPAGGPVGSVVQLYADVDNPGDGPGPTSYAWTCGGGLLAGSKLETTFHCTRSGVSTVNLTLSDGDAACSESQAFLYVVCTDAKCLAAHNCDALPDPVAGSGGTLTAAAGVGASGAGAGGSSAGVGGVGAVISANAGSTATTNTNPSTTQSSAGAGGAGGHAPAADGGSWEPPTWPKSGGAGGVGGAETHDGEDVPRHHHRAAAGSGGIQATPSGQGGATAGSAAATSAAGSTASGGAGASSASVAGSGGATSTNVAGNEATTAGAAANAAGMGGEGPANTSGAGGAGI